MPHKPGSLRLIHGGLDYSCRIGATRIGIVPLEAPAPVVDAVVVEQDTHGLLAVEPLSISPQESLTSLTRRLAAFVPYRGGDVIVKRAEPLQLLAIVHDLDLSPSWQERWIVTALDTTLKLAGRHRLRRLGMAALGTVHGRLPLERFFELLAAAVAAQAHGPEQIWVGVKRRECHMALGYLKQHCASL